LRLYRDALGLEQLEAWEEGDARGVLLGGGRATLELFNEAQAELIDKIEVGQRSAGPVRIAFEVDDSAATAGQLVEAGAETVGAPVVTPWNHRNVRLRAPDGMQLTLFTVLD
jgi:catechol 2,3-dioxygenase-like lactoylglutathione lyase family enzyme